MYCTCKWNFPAFQWEGWHGSSQRQIYLCWNFFGFSNVFLWLQTHSWITWSLIACLSYSQFHSWYPSSKSIYPKPQLSFLKFRISFSGSLYLWSRLFLWGKHSCKEVFVLSKLVTKQHPSKEGSLHPKPGIWELSECSSSGTRPALRISKGTAGQKLGFSGIWGIQPGEPSQQQPGPTQGGN